jgi:hypothetical protein
MEKLTYKIVSKGIAEGHSLEKVKKSLAAIFKIDPPEAENFLKTDNIELTKDLDYEKALKYKKVFEKAGLNCSLIENTNKEDDDLILSIEDIDDDVILDITEEEEQLPASTNLKCPNCGFEQSKTLACTKCGIIFDKFHKSNNRETNSLVGGVRIIDEEKDELTKPFNEQLSGLFTYPFGGRGLYIILGGAVFFELQAFIGIFLMRFGLIFFFAGYTCAYMLKIISRSAAGDETPPGWPDFESLSETVLIPLAMVKGTALFSFLPALLYAFLSTQPSTTASTPFSMSIDPVLIILIVLGFFYYPMGLLAIAQTRRVFNLNPVLILSSISKVFGDYFLVCVILFALWIIKLVIQFFIVLPVPAIIGSTVNMIISLYILLVEMRLIGILYNANRDKFSWFGEY